MLDPPRGPSPSDDNAVKPLYQPCLTSEHRGVRFFRHPCHNFLWSLLLVAVLLKAALTVKKDIDENLPQSKPWLASFGPATSLAKAELPKN